MGPERRTRLGQQGVQYGALPYRLKTSGKLEFLLVTSRDTGRWVIPKGWPMRLRSPAQTAKREALEEAGVEGRIANEAVGAFAYEKHRPGAEPFSCVVQVFPLQVTKERPRWPEERERKRQWFSRKVAATLVREPELRALFETFEPDRIAA